MALLDSEKLKTAFKTLETDIQKWLEPKDDSGPLFEVCFDVESNRHQFQTSNREEFLILLFSRLANYFEKGYLLETSSQNQKNHWFCSLHFTEGQIYMAEPPIAAEFPVPSPGPHKVLSSHPAQWALKSEEWLQLIPQENVWKALVFEVTPEVRFLFCSRLADPWLKIQTENAHRFIEVALAAYHG